MNEQQTPMTPERLDEIEARANAATPGPWFLDRERPYAPCVWTGYDEAMGGEVAEYLARRGYIQPGDDYPRGHNHPTENMEFIAASRTDVPELVAEVRRLRAALEYIEMHTTGSWESDPHAWMDAIRERAQQALGWTVQP